MTMAAKSNSRQVHALPSSVSTPTVQTSEEVRHADKSSAAIAEDLREALQFQRAQYDNLQNYLLTITKKYEEEKTATDQTIEMLERDVRKKTREIEGLRWLVMHNGKIGDMGSVDHLTEQLDSDLDKGEDKDAELEGADKPGSPTKLKRAKTLPDFLSPPTGKPRQQNNCISMPVSIQSQGLCIEFPIPRDESVSSLELPAFESSSAASSQSSLSLPALTPSTVSSGLSAIPEMPRASTSRPDRTSTANSVSEQQREKEERRASRALRRISTSSLSSSVALSTSKSQPISSRQPRPSSFGLSIEQPRSMEDVLERLKPFGST
ncbi:hypothetical protein SERLA73DRAFT_179448 [Serpula lacrymans var. lacrymans S7.3]|uniref:Uncharacterized protein n=2 Tax=Serpula lacrymans var. lacrymans TaxID=341189 RepID=F8PSG5_SERL3|nr:uncharacterized protein SERLADRAFT_464577 [Serpula lacrymans var. lacrymans S7.9]EGO01295.1 hypothetical protein SERLA73DRAFT_179448 [Serpula lacrymans var. lacrymans S7.3]EGO26934.1 hypothetical protein SERLADRAFT_464577 [Serpula lacrymans var. lacrymans S7.9]